MGSGHPLIILHGLFGMLDNWLTIGKRLSADFEVIIADQRNHGRSPHNKEMDYHLMADDVHELIEEVGIGKSHILGHSMGGKTAMQLAFDHPGLIEKLVVVDILPSRYPGSHDVLFESMCKLKPEEIKSRQEAETLLSEDIHDIAIRQFLLKNLKRNDKGQFGWKMNLSAIRNNYNALLGEIEFNWPFNGKALMIKGALSPYVPENRIPDLYEYFPNIDIVTIQDAGHWVHAEQPELFLKSVQSFLK